MRAETVEFLSEGTCVRGVLRMPDAAPPFPAVVHGPGWLGMADAPVFRTWWNALTAAGFAVLTVDHRGFGASDGDRRWVRPDWQVEDVLNAVTYLVTRTEVDASRIGAFGTGATGGGNAIVAAAAADRIRCVVAVSPIADGRRWLQSMRDGDEWSAFLRRLDEDRGRWVTEGRGEEVDPWSEITIATPARRARGFDPRVGRRWLRSAEHLLRYRPIDVVHHLAPRGLLVTCVEGDEVTPEEHAVALFQRAGSPKRLVRQLGTSHYGAATDTFEALSAEVVRWLTRWLADGGGRDHSGDRTATTVEVRAPAREDRPSGT